MEMEPCDSSGQVPRKVSEKGIQQDSEDVGVKKPPMESAATNAASGGLVYVRRRVEVDTAKGTATNPPPKAVAISSPISSSSPHGPTSSSISHKLDWEERYHHLQMLLNKLNESDQTEHLQMLWSLSSAELSKHAVELEKKSIQFSLEEGWYCFSDSVDGERMGAKGVSRCLSAIHAELEAILWAIESLVALHILEVEVSTDYETAVRILHQPED